MIETTIHDGRARLLYGRPNVETLRSLDAESIHCVVTSPPYWGLRDYGDDEQIGLESTPEEFVETMVSVFAEVRRVLHPSGTLWLNLGDSYHEKQLVGIPWRVALALQADGWWFRQEIIWHKPNTMPEPCADRCTKAHESIFLLTKSPRYFFDADAIAEPTVRSTDNGSETATPTRNRRNVWTIQTQAYAGAHFAVFPEEIPRLAIIAGSSEAGVCSSCLAPWVREREKVGERIDRWSASNTFDGYRERQGTAVYETTGWSAGCDCDETEPVPATILDPFSGSGTTGKVALGLGRNYVGLDVNEDYLDLAIRRVDQFQSDSATKDEEAGQMTLFDGVDK